MSKIAYFEGIVDLKSHSLHFSGDLLKKEIPFSYKKISYFICFPSANWNKRDSFGHPTFTLKDTAIQMDWTKRGIASVSNWNEETKQVTTFSTNKLIIRSQKRMSEDKLNVSKKELLEWKDLLVLWTEAFLYIDTQEKSMKVAQQDEIECYSINQNKNYQRIDNTNTPIHIKLNITKSIHPSQLEKILALASKDSPPLPHILLISALKHYNNREYRQCIIDATTAFEIVLSKMLDDQLANVQPKIKIFIKKQHRGGMGKYLSTLSELGVKIDMKKIEKKLSKPRNEVIHEGIDISEGKARKSLELAKAFIWEKVPIAK